jgi:protein-S-isoprenylcysteine O-methyltransferase Ste14
MVGALVALISMRLLFSSNLLAISVQVGAAVLMVWARVAFGRRSFHAAGNPTEGGLVTSGPYRHIRHPIYTAACLFGWAGVLAHLSVTSLICGLSLLAGAVARMLCEEKLVAASYPEYAAYAARTWRMIPWVF